MVRSQLVFKLRNSFPRLAWCARISPETPDVQVTHGPWAECAQNAFVEGAWDGPFSEFDFDRSPALQGTGGRIRDGRLVLCTPTHPLDRLYTVRYGDSLLISNSLACLLAESDDGPDFAYPDYFFLLLRHFRQGVSPGLVSLPTAKGRQVRLFAVCNLNVEPDLTITTSAKAPGPEPSNYADYESFLLSTVETTVANAADASRIQRYETVAAVSRGYDSVASASVAARVGCRKAVTYATSGHLGRWTNDHGGEVAASLGMEIETFDREDVHQLAPERQAEHFLSPMAHGDRTVAVMADGLAGNFLFTGRHGERVWAKNPACGLPNLEEPDATLLTGISTFEQRLRCGWLEFHVPYVGALHSPALHRITLSEEMRSWSIGGHYDRPIARRLAEDAGVPRNQFGQSVAGGVAKSMRRLSPDAQQAYELFCRVHVPPEILTRLRDNNTRMGRTLAVYSTRLRLRFGYRPHWNRLFQAMGLDRLHALHCSERLYQFHWGLHLSVEQVRAAEPASKSLS